MKKYTNKILVITVALLLVAGTTIFFIEASKVKQEGVKQEINHSDAIELIIK